MAQTRGATLSCTSIHGEVLRGDVVAKDEKTQVVVIKESSDSSSACTTHVINLSNVTNVSITGSMPWTAPARLPNIDVQKVEQRRRQNEDAKWKRIKSKGVNVSEEAQQLFDSLLKLYTDTRWEGNVIVVLGDVRISPPYTSETCTGSNSLLDRVQKQVKKLQEERS